MKYFFFLPAIFLLTVSADKCGKKETATGKYRARLETKALCMNYTLRLLEGDIDTSLISVNWVDESTGKAYTNVFGLGSRCSFPSNIEQGDDFYFVIDTAQKQECAVCMAYYPTPPKKLYIKVVDK